MRAALRSRPIAASLLASLLAVAAAIPARAQDPVPDLAPETVTLRSAPRPLGRLEQRFAEARGEDPGPRPGDALRGLLFRPKTESTGGGRHPAAVLLHGCSGLRGTTLTRDLPADLVGRGYVVLVVDSFATRGIEHACTAETAARYARLRPLDAYGGLAHLAGLPEVDARRVAVIGASQGGWAALAVAAGRYATLAAAPDGLAFRAAVAFYPPCDGFDGTMAMPTLILAGERDDWTPAEACRRMMAARSGEGAEVSLTVFPGAHHGFNARELSLGRSSFGHWLAYDAAATARSVELVRAFLDRVNAP